MSLTYISDHFTWKEAACKDGTAVPMRYQPNARRLALEVLEPLRLEYGKPLRIVSWYRTPEYNARVKGEDKSQHLTASAADIQPYDMADFQAVLKTLREMLDGGRLPVLGGWGVYPTFTHVDVRPRKHDGSIYRW